MLLTGIMIIVVVIILALNIIGSIQDKKAEKEQTDLLKDIKNNQTK